MLAHRLHSILHNFQAKETTFFTMWLSQTAQRLPEWMFLASANFALSRLQEFETSCTSSRTRLLVRWWRAGRYPSNGFEQHVAFNMAPWFFQRWFGFVFTLNARGCPPTTCVITGGSSTPIAQSCKIRAGSPSILRPASTEMTSASSSETLRLFVPYDHVP